MDKEHTIIQMGQCTKEHGDRISQMIKEPLNSQMVQYIKANGKIINFMELDFMSIIQDSNGKDNLDMDYFKAKNRLKC